MAHSRSFLANQKVRNAKVGAENLRICDYCFFLAFYIVDTHGLVGDLNIKSETYLFLGVHVVVKTITLQICRLGDYLKGCYLRRLERVFLVAIVFVKR